MSKTIAVSASEFDLFAAERPVFCVAVGGSGRESAGLYDVEGRLKIFLSEALEKTVWNWCEENDISIIWSAERASYIVLPEDDDQKFLIKMRWM